MNEIDIDVILRALHSSDLLHKVRFPLHTTDDYTTVSFITLTFSFMFDVDMLYLIIKKFLILLVVPCLSHEMSAADPRCSVVWLHQERRDRSRHLSHPHHGPHS